MQYNILLAQPIPVIAEGIKKMIEDLNLAKKFYASPTGSDAVMLARSFEANVVVLDAALTDMDVVVCVKQIKAEVPNAVIIITGELNNARHISALRRAGATGFMQQGFTADDLAEAIQQTTAGENYFGGRVGNITANHLIKIMEKQSGANAYGLNGMDKVMLEELFLCTSIADIAAKYKKTVKAIEANRKNLFTKLGVKNAPEAILMALRKRIYIDPEI